MDENDSINVPLDTEIWERFCSEDWQMLIEII
jgi:hypothetical protein